FQIKNGVNKLGTLLSSQTTNTPPATPTPTRRSHYNEASVSSVRFGIPERRGDKRRLYTDS
ncbi:hypothetical protein, partial [Galactobacter valiniphilus]|uniref:hypothetical protein n=1 Tax=Galactobacter valiniphilus TaxID=2676122 RepID=UPI003736923D